MYVGSCLIVSVSSVALFVILGMSDLQSLSTKTLLWFMLSLTSFQNKLILILLIMCFLLNL